MVDTIHWPEVLVKNDNGKNLPKRSNSIRQGCIAISFVEVSWGRLNSVGLRYLEVGNIFAYQATC